MIGITSGHLSTAGQESHRRYGKLSWGRGYGDGHGEAHNSENDGTGFGDGVGHSDPHRHCDGSGNLSGNGGYTDAGNGNGGHVK